jgi:hypothetical protein
MNLNKPKILIFSLLLSGLCEIMYSQTDTLVKRDSCLNNILETKVLRKGFYRNINEFQTNSPYYTYNFSTFKYDRSAEYYLKVKGNGITLKDRSGKNVNIGKPIWGFCDGTKAYYIDDLSVNEIILFGRFCIYTDSKDQYGSNLGYNPISYQAIGGSYSALPEYFLNILTGKEMHLTIKNLKDFILVDDPELLEQFNKENIPKSVMFLYVKRYNERHPVSF